MRLGAQTKKTVLRRAIFSCLILLAAVLQNTPGLFPEIFGVPAMLLIPVVVCTGMYERDIPGLFYGLFAGIVWDICSAGPPGLNAVMLMTFGFVSGALIGTVMRNNLVTALLLTGSAVFIYNTVYWIFAYVVKAYDGALMAYLTFYLPSVLYTVLLMPVFYFIVKAVKNKIG